MSENPFEVRECGHPTVHMRCPICKIVALDAELGRVIEGDLKTARAERDAALLQVGKERERCVKVVEEFADWAFHHDDEMARECGQMSAIHGYESLKRLAAEIRATYKPESQHG